MRWVLATWLGWTGCAIDDGGLARGAAPTLDPGPVAADAGPAADDAGPAAAPPAPGGDDCAAPSRGFVDADGDGWGGGPELETCEPVDTVAAGGDCDDADPLRHPAAAEACDGRDDDCDGAIDEGGVCPCVALPGGRHHACTQWLPWAGARAFCAAHGLELAVLDSAAELSRVGGALGALSAGTGNAHEDWWIGASRAGGVFRWTDDAAVSWAPWSAEEPDAGGDCVEVLHDDEWRWNDAPCAWDHPFVCEVRD